MTRSYTVEVMDYTSEGKIYCCEQPIERPLREEDEAGLFIGQRVLAAIDSPNFSVLCKVMHISDTNIRLRKFS